ncbi:MAG: 5-formyltetrahydrofolate cyclo-ligase [Coriobacteriia bacterium]|nr:5-formyltetrahydrofolate cyclo-ligase [Coriobacteriia bacterium]
MRKAELRAHARALRAMLPARRRGEQALAIAERLLGLPEVAAAGAVLAYGASEEEADPRPAVDALRERGVRIAYPRIAGEGCLALHWVSSAEELQVGALGIREPAGTCACAEPSGIDVVLVPGIAFGRDGYRLGFGAGYYDRFLPTVPDAFKVGLAYEVQLFDTVPHEAHDVPLDAVITPSAIVR